MKKGKFQNKGSKIVVLMLAMMLVFGVAVGGTLAWLLDSTQSVTNTFTVGDIDIELWEHDLKADGTLDETKEVTSENTYKILPGTEQPKDPFVRFVEDSEACWLFVKVEAKNNDVTGKNYDYVTYTVDTSIWTALDGVAGVYYKELTAAEAKANTEYDILTNDEVSYSPNLTKAELNAVGENNKPQLVFTAYAIQSEGLNAADATAAWNAFTAASGA